MGGLVAAGNQTTADLAGEILRRGGNAVDAAVGAAFASCLSEIAFVHLGGSGIALIFDPSEGEPVVYDFFSRAPGLGRRRPPAHLDFYRTTVDYGPTTQDFYLGRGAVAVPGNVIGLCRMHADCGRLRLQDVLAPVVRLADEGILLDPFQADTCRLLKRIYTATPSVREIFMPGGTFLKAGQHLSVPGLSMTLRGIQEHGSRYLSHEALGAALIDDQDRRGGLLTFRDLREYRPARKDPIRIPYRGYQILLPPHCSAGGALTSFSLKLLSECELAKLEWGSAGHLRLLAEVMAATSRARPRWDRLVEDSGAAGAAAERFLAAGHLERTLQKLRNNTCGRAPGAGPKEADGPSSTTHLSVIDKDGMAVSLTHSAGESAGYVVPGTGFIPNNMMGEADLHPQGFHSVAPGHEIATMMAPVIVVQDDRVRAVIGSGGSTRIRTALLQVISNFIDFGFSLESAVQRPRVHYQDGILQCEKGFAENTRRSLKKKGYQVKYWDSQSIYFGGAHCVEIRPDGRAVATGDPRRGGAIWEA